MLQKSETNSMPPSALSLVILTHNELDELRVLLPWLEQHRANFDELIIIDDFSNTEVDQLLNSFECKVYKRQLNGDFSSQRNYALKVCSGEFVFFIDADEVPAHQLLSQLRKILAEMQAKNCEICSIPRLNVVLDRDEFVDCTKLNFSDQQLIDQFPDEQLRIIRMGCGIHFKYAVHEHLVGGNKGLRLPLRVDLCLLHVKRIRRLERQNQMYSKLEGFSARVIVRTVLRKSGMTLAVKAIRGWFGPRWILFDYD